MANNGLPARSPERLAAQIRADGLINMRRRRGRLARPDRCSQCGRVGKVDGHHDDYQKADEVLWLCRSCHMKRHFWLLHQHPQPAEQSA